MANVTERDESAAVDVLDRWKNEWSLEGTESEWHKHVDDSLRHHIACAVSEARAAAEWQPIETAPHDGSRILVAGGDCADVLSVYWDDKFDFKLDEAESGHFIGAWTDDAVRSFGYEEKESYNPTHWMPLP